MDSFYGDLQPRNVPNPTSFIQDNILNPLVPDVSMIFDKSKITQSSYNAWKKNDKENLETNNDFMRKQVRFQSSSSNQFSINNYNNQLSNKNNYIEKESKTLSENNKISLLNELELSLLDSKPKENSIFIPKISENVDRSIKSSYHNWILTNIKEKQLDEAKKAENIDPKVSELFQIVQNQNELLINLQRKVEMLLQQNIDEKTRNYLESIKQSNNPQKKIRNAETNTSYHKPETISVGVMTSFKMNDPVCIPQKQNLLQNLKINTGRISEPFLQQRILGNNASNVTTEGFSRCRDYSLSEIPEIPENLEETLLSSNSIHVDLQEFEESDEEEKLEENHSGWTVYNNVVGKVQNILEKSPRENNEDQLEDGNQIVVNNIKMATINQLRELAISNNDLRFPNLSPRYVPGSPHTNDLSIEVNQLVMKYLKDDQLSFIMARNKKICSPQQNQPIIFPTPPNYQQTPVNNEMSFATVKYMQKYRLWSHRGTKSPDQIATCNIQKMSMSRSDIPLNKYKSQSKILDITALKQQPKLL